MTQTTTGKGCNVFQQLADYGVVPVIAIESVEAALPMADALIEGGLPVAEITFRTAAAAQVVKALSTERPQLLLGAGTILTLDNLEAARDCGAQFGVAPGLNPAIVRRAKEIGLPFMPGVATPSDIEAGLSLGCTVLKFFPSEALGGAKMIKALAAPYAHTGVRFVPTGGVNDSNLSEYLAMKAVAAVGGTWIAKMQDLAEGRWNQIAERCRAAIAAAKRARAGA
jgi:2-dehydro-3-deoxyphosphogluconate aldolase / (4S)-4-hydroxy-2-oxoglutarate aldolase